MSKQLLLLISLTVILTTAVATYIINGSGNTPKAIKKSEIDIAVNQAMYIYQQRKAAGQDFSNGPCLSDALMPGWVLDIAHNPRLPIDDLPQNQCPAYREGRAQHFVELDIYGNLIRAK